MSILIRRARADDVCALAELKLTTLREAFLEDFAIPYPQADLAKFEVASYGLDRTEDSRLIAGVQQGMSSSSYMAGPLGESEVCLRSFARKLRNLIPQARLTTPPPMGWSGRLAGGRMI